MGSLLFQTVHWGLRSFLFERTRQNHMPADPRRCYSTGKRGWGVRRQAPVCPTAGHRSRAGPSAPGWAPTKSQLALGLLYLKSICSGNQSVRNKGLFLLLSPDVSYMSFILSLVYTWAFKLISSILLGVDRQTARFIPTENTLPSPVETGEDFMSCGRHSRASVF